MLPRVYNEWLIFPLITSHNTFIKKFKNFQQNIPVPYYAQHSDNYHIISYFTQKWVPVFKSMEKSLLDKLQYTQLAKQL